MSRNQKSEVKKSTRCLTGTGQENPERQRAVRGTPIITGRAINGSAKKRHSYIRPSDLAVRASRGRFHHRFGIHLQAGADAPGAGFYRATQCHQGMRLQQTPNGSSQKLQLDVSYSGLCMCSWGTSSTRRHATMMRSSGMVKITLVEVLSAAEGCAVAAHKIFASWAGLV
jgi:hypothetical protein